MNKVTVVGAGKYGSMTALRIAEYDIVQEVVMTDIVEGLPQGLALDINQSRFVEQFNTKLIGTNDYKDTEGSDVVVITAGLPRKFVFLSLLHFMITKGINATLYSKTLGSIGFWGFLFLIPWSNFKFYFGSVLPNWIENISLYLSISLSLPLLAIVVNFFRTVSTRIDENKVIYSLISFSFGIFVITNIFQIVSSLSNIIPILSLTNFEIAIRYGYVFSAILITISFVYYLIPKIFGREVKFSRLESLTSFLLKLVVSLTLFSNALIGIISGYSWNAGANAGNPTIYGEGFGLLWSLISTPLTLNMFLSLTLLLPFLLFFISVVKAVVNGEITEAETIELTEEELPV